MHVCLIYARLHTFIHLILSNCLAHLLTFFMCLSLVCPSSSYARLSNSCATHTTFCSILSKPVILRLPLRPSTPARCSICSSVSESQGLPATSSTRRCVAALANQHKIPPIHSRFFAGGFFNNQSDGSFSLLTVALSVVHPSLLILIRLTLVLLLRAPSPAPIRPSMCLSTASCTWGCCLLASQSSWGSCSDRAGRSLISPRATPSASSRHTFSSFSSHALFTHEKILMRGNAVVASPTHFTSLSHTQKHPSRPQHTPPVLPFHCTSSPSIHPSMHIITSPSCVVVCWSR